MAKRSRNIEDWEAALIKAMLVSGKFTKDQIVSVFTRPDRTVNPWRIAEIEKSKAHPDVDPAAPVQVEAYLEAYRSPGKARRLFFDENPLHPVNLRGLFYLKEGTADVLQVDETDRIECKESLNFAGKAKYGRVIVSFANARGGFLLFGVRDGDKVVTGINPGTLTGYDSSKLTQYLASHFSPVPIWEKAEMPIAGKTIGIIYVPAAEQKPIICTCDDGSVLREADIYYRYPGETRRVRYAELVGMLEARSRRTEQQWADVMRRVESAGVENVAILDTATGEVSGRAGKFLIDEKLIPKLKFIEEGTFSEKDGAPTLRLVGNLEPVSAAAVQGIRTVVRKELLTDGDILQEFVDQATVETPRYYAGHLAHSQKLWLPVYYFMRQAGMDEDALVALLSEGPNTKRTHLDRLIARVKGRRRPSMSKACTAANTEPERSQLLAQSAERPKSVEECNRLLKAVMALQPGEIYPDYLLPLLGECLRDFHERLGTQLAYAITCVDIAWHEQIVGTDRERKVP